MSDKCVKCGATLPPHMSACAKCNSPASQSHNLPQPDPISAFTSAPARPEMNGLAILGGFLLIAGVCATVYFAFFFASNVQLPTSEIVGQPYGDRLRDHLGLMAHRQTGILLGMATAVVGLILTLSVRKKPQPA